VAVAAPSQLSREEYMTSDDIQFWTLLVRLCGLGVSVLGLVLVLRQLKQVGQTMQGNAFSNSFSELREIHKVFVSYPELRPYFFDGKVLTGESDYYQRARSVAEMYLDAFVHMYLLRSRFPKDLRHHVDLLIRDMINRSTFLAGYLRENYTFMPDSLRLLVSSLIETRRE
jgi:hypothetical protein